MVDYNQLTKLYYSIGEVSEIFGVSNSLVRYWETEFKMLKPKKNRKGDRQFTVKDIKVLEKIHTLVKERGFTIDGARKELKSEKKSPPSSSNKKIKDQLLKLRATLLSLKK